jgi:hypothetical protein
MRSGRRRSEGVEVIVCRHERQRPVETAQPDGSVGWSRRRDERQLETVALRAPVERYQQTQTRGVHEGQPAQIEYQAPGILDSIQRGMQHRNGGKVELAVGSHDRDVVASLHVDSKRLGATPFDRRG